MQHTCHCPKPVDYNIHYELVEQRVSFHLYLVAFVEYASHSIFQTSKVYNVILQT